TMDVAMQIQESPVSEPAARAAIPRPLWLSDEQRVWLIAEGTVDLFAVALQTGASRGQLHHLFRASAGQALFGLGRQYAVRGIGILARPSAGARLEPIRLEQLREHARQPEAAGQLAAWIDGWVAGLASAGARGLAPKESFLLAPGRPLELPHDAPARAAAGVLWLQHTEGDIRLMDDPDVILLARTLPFPLAGQAWVRAAGATKLHPVDTRACLQGELIWAGLELFHVVMLDAIRAWMAAQEQNDQARLHSAAEHTQDAVLQALLGLAGV